jgi:hypothetical protein
VWYLRCCAAVLTGGNTGLQLPTILYYVTAHTTSLRPALRLSTPQTRTCSFKQAYSATNQLTLRQRCYFQRGTGNGWRSIPCSGTRLLPPPAFLRHTHPFLPVQRRRSELRMSHECATPRSSDRSSRDLQVGRWLSVRWRSTRGAVRGLPACSWCWQKAGLPS